MMSKKVVLVIGGSKGIGFATAELFAEKGFNVIITGRNEKDLEEARNTLGENVEIIRSDVSRVDEIERLFNAVEIKYPKIDVLFVNAGIAEPKDIANVSVDEFDSQMDINFKGAYFTIQKALKLLGKQSSIVINASVASVMSIKELTVYSASKAALVSLVKTLALELAGNDIRINSVSPGATMTDLYMKNNKDVHEQVCASIPLNNRPANPEEIASVVYFLAIEATYMTGQDLIVDGGLSLKT